ncbi:MAG: M48 family metalloprotease [Helicobacteraceae bacterium]|nr:M48 family metalloprotease [Helicobacteraceae bacterium]
MDISPIANAVIIFYILAIMTLSFLDIKNDAKNEDKTVPEKLGAIAASPSNLIEKRLLNIVDEMALASGVFPPNVYILNDDEAINALTAGENRQKASIIVTSGALQYLTRDELQGVIAHEFCHIRNEHMKAGTLMRWLFLLTIMVSVISILFLAATAFALLLDYKSYAPVVLMFVPFVIIGLIGFTCASMIQSAFNRQRDFLADASSLQFCRHDGIVSALKKVGGLGSIVKTPGEFLYGHYFFNGTVKSSQFATQPPLFERIKRLDPDWNGQFIIAKALKNDEDLSVENDINADRDKKATIATVTNVAIALSDKNNVMQKIQHIATDTNAIDLLGSATANIEAIPEYLRETACDPLSARWIIYALLIDRCDRAVAARQNNIISERVYTGEFNKIVSGILYLKRESVVHLIFLCVPALKNLTIDQYKHFREVADLLIEEDGKVSLFEFNLKYLVFYPLDIAFDLRKPPRVIYNSFMPIPDVISVALSAIVYDQYKNDDEAKLAFYNACKSINGLEYVPSSKILTQTLERAYDRIQQANDEIKRHIIDLAIASVKSDNVIAPEEAETIHALRSALGLGYM